MNEQNVSKNCHKNSSLKVPEKQNHLSNKIAAFKCLYFVFSFSTIYFFLLSQVCGFTTF